MIREFETRIDGDETYAFYSNEEVYIEVPLSDETETTDKIDQALLLAAMGKIQDSNIRDDVYVNQEVVRQDYNITADESAAIIDELKLEFPDYANWERTPENLVGRYTGYREPYLNPSISFYDYGITPSETLQLAFNTSYAASNLRNWYGLKFDLTTKQVAFKAVVNTVEFDTPELPTGPLFYAITHNQNGSVGQWVDAYVYATPKRIRLFCETKGLAYPLPPTTHLECAVVFCWGFVFHRDTLEYGPVKAYARYNLQP
jgi:hypothetical protein